MFIFFKFLVRGVFFKEINGNRYCECEQEGKPDECRSCEFPDSDDPCAAYDSVVEIEELQTASGKSCADGLYSTSQSECDKKMESADPLQNCYGDCCQAARYCGVNCVGNDESISSIALSCLEECWNTCVDERDNCESNCRAIDF